jgi:hypothetical protein
MEARQMANKTVGNISSSSGSYFARTGMCVIHYCGVTFPGPFYVRTVTKDLKIKLQGAPMVPVNYDGKQITLGKTSFKPGDRVDLIQGNLAFDRDLGDDVPQNAFLFFLIFTQDGNELWTWESNLQHPTHT